MCTGFRLSSADFASAMNRRSRMSWIGWFCVSVWAMATPSGASGLWKRRAKSRPFAFQWLTAPVEHLHLPDHLVERAVAERGHHLAHFLGDEEEDS